MTSTLNHHHQRVPLLLLILCCYVTAVLGTPKCVWVRGALQCHRDPSKQQNVEVRVIDRDGWGPLKIIDPDDLMGVTFTEPDGTFQLDGCGNDFNIIPGVPNLPDPFVRIHHFCNSEEGETLELPEFDTFVPDTHDFGILVLDSTAHPNATVTFPVPANPRRRGQRPASVGRTGSSSEEKLEPKNTDGEEQDKGKTKQEEPELVTVNLPTKDDPHEPLPPGKTVAKADEPVEMEVESVELLSPAEELGQERRNNWTKKKQSAEEEVSK